MFLNIDPNDISPHRSWSWILILMTSHLTAHDSEYILFYVKALCDLQNKEKASLRAPDMRAEK